ncbi:MAG: hypothetical protein IPP32_03765 [Bacteroidetes bacterium]|nr:hypothetical protein [Bacteroidota bacterium]
MKKGIKNMFLLGVAFALANSGYAQSKEELNRIAISSYVSDQIAAFPEAAKDQLKNKLSQVVTQNGMTGGLIGSRFIITPNINVLTKDIIAGPPAMNALTLEVTLFVGDGVDGKKFASKSVTVKGVGTNETKAYIEALRMIKPNDPGIMSMLEDAQKKIINYYNTSCDAIVKSAEGAASTGNYEAAIAQLTSIPDVCKACYDKGMAAATPIYKKYNDFKCGTKLAEARAAWNANQNAQGAGNAGVIMASIDPNASCYSEVLALNKEISARMTELGDKEWDYKFEERQGDVEIEKARIKAYRDIGVSYYSKPVTIYNVRGWW